MDTLNDMKIKTATRIAEDEIGAAYVWGSWGAKCTPEERKQRAEYSPAYKDKIYKYCLVLNSGGRCEDCKYDGRRAFDCRGMTDYVLKMAGIIDLAGEGATSQWNTKQNWDAKGEMTDMPDLPLLVLFREKSGGGGMSHTGLYTGNGNMIHARGHASGVVRQALGTEVKMTHWAIPKGLYTQEEIENAGVRKVYETVRNGSTGVYAKTLQVYLNDLGYPCGKADGIAGEKTIAALKAFQKDAGLNADGICGAKTWKALEDALEKKHEAPVQPEEPEITDPPSDGLQELKTKAESAKAACEDLIAAIDRIGQGGR